MEPKFEIRYFADQTMMAEFYRKIAIGPRPLMVVLGAVVYAFFVVRSWWWGILLEMLPTLAMMGIVFTALYFIPDWFTWLNLRQARKQNDNEMPETVVTVGDAIEMQEGMAHYTIEYRRIVKVVHLQHSYVLMIGKRNGLVLNPRGFTKGSFAEFKQFLREKRPDLNIPE